MASSSDSDSDDFLFDSNLVPYDHEPTLSRFPNFKSGGRFEVESEIGDSQLTGASSTTDVTDRPETPSWFSCGFYVPMAIEVEELCCQDVAPITERQGQQYPCITEHPGLQEVCLSQYDMEAYYNEFVDTNGPVGNDEPAHKVYRYLAYRKFTFWIWKKLGKNHRKVIPSCAVNKIRAKYPSDSYIGFLYSE